MTQPFGAQSMVEPLRRVLVKRPDEAFGNADPARWHYTSRPDLEEARREHDALVEILHGAGAEVIDHPAPQPERADAIFVFDPVIVTERGAGRDRGSVPDERADQVDELIRLALEKPNETAGSESARLALAR